MWQNAKSFLITLPIKLECEKLYGRDFMIKGEMLDGKLYCGWMDFEGFEDLRVFESILSPKIQN
jgi:hypothetical protein